MIKPQLNLIVIINDGLRWQEVFRGAEEILINDTNLTPDPVSLRSLFWDNDREHRRRKLLPFMWDIVAKQGRLFGDRDVNSKVNVANPYAISYSGYNEIFTGTTDVFIATNKKRYNKNINVLELLEKKPDFKNKIAVFSSWDSFPFILNNKRNGLIINNGYERSHHSKVKVKYKEGLHGSEDTNYDMLTFVHAMNYIKEHHPRITVLVFGEADVVAHKKRYDLYLSKTHQADTMMAELWNFVQTTEGYKNNTSFIITTDHGRGSSYRNWHDHGFFIRGSSQTWLALVGPGLSILKTRLEKRQLYNKQIAGFIANMVGEDIS